MRNWTAPAIALATVFGLMAGSLVRGAEARAGRMWCLYWRISGALRDGLRGRSECEDAEHRPAGERERGLHARGFGVSGVYALSCFA